MLDLLFERRSFVATSGDVDEFVTLTLRNISSQPCDAVQSYGFKFDVTDGRATLISWHDLGGESNREDQDPHPAMTAVHIVSKSSIAPGATRVVGIHALRRGGATVTEQEISFRDTLYYRQYDALPIKTQRCTITVIFPEDDKGWLVSATGAHERTTRTAAWTFPYDADRATNTTASRGTTESTAMLIYDDLLAEAHRFYGQNACGEPIDSRGFIKKLAEPGLSGS